LDATYVLITPARNEQDYIRNAIESIICQTILPARWVIVSDGSTDGTDEVVREYALRYPFIELVCLHERAKRTFASQAYATNAGYETVRHMKADFIGLLDADISLPPDYYERILERFKQYPQLGIAGGVLLEKIRGRYGRRFGDSDLWVAGAIQMFRRKCYEDIGGFIPLPYGGHDAVAVAVARSKGWEVKSFLDLEGFHHRPTGSVGANRVRICFRNGAEDYYLGYDLLFEMGKSLRYVAERPYILGTFLRLSGYLWQVMTASGHALPKDLIRTVRRQKWSGVIDKIRMKTGMTSRVYSERRY